MTAMLRKERCALILLLCGYFLSMIGNLHLAQKMCADRSINSVAIPGGLPQSHWYVAPTNPRTAIVYAFSATSPEHVENFLFFLAHGLSNNAFVDYFFVLNGDEQYASLIPHDHPRVKGVYIRENSCYDFGAWIHAVRVEKLPLEDYVFFVFLNSGARGPFYPTYLPMAVPHWHYALTLLLTDDVKLVGTTINCGGKGEAVHPHVQSMAFATDAVGLEIILAHKTAFNCYTDDRYDRDGLIIRHELGLSRAILSAGYNIASLMRSTHGIDYRNTANWNCNEKHDPYSQKGYDAGLGLHFYELLFFKTTRGFLEKELAATTAAINKRLDQQQPPVVIHSPSFPFGADANLIPIDTPIAVDIIITIYGAASYVDETLATIFKHSDALIVIHVILVADGDPDAEVRSVVLKHTRLHPQDITFLIRPRKGYTFAVNAALKEFQRRAVASFVVILNSDVVVTKGWLRKMVATAMSSVSIGAVGPLSNAASVQSVPDIYVGNGTTEMSLNYLKDDWTVDGMAKLVESMSLRLYPSFRILNGFCVLFKAHVFSQVGFFDEEHFGLGYGEENDYAIRMTSAGFTLVVDDATWIYHLKSKSFGHEARKNLSISASQALRKKYSDKFINKVLAELRANSQTLYPLRSALHTALASPLLKEIIYDTSPLKILYLLPVASLGGGQVSVVQEAIALNKAGAYVKLALPINSWPLFIGNFPELQSLDIVCPTLSKIEMETFAGLFDVVVATVYHTVASTLEPIHLRFPRVLPAYYVQDSESSFFTPGSNASEEATQSYHKVATWGGLLFAKTDWLLQEVLKQHNILMRKVTPIVEPLLPVSSNHIKSIGDSDPVRLVALIRPATPRRNSLGTLSTLSMLKQRYGDSVSIRTFGCTVQEFAELTTRNNFSITSLSEIQHLGLRNRSELGQLFLETDAFIDLSEWQAFGRTSVEAMTASCTCIVPKVGGYAEFAVDGINAFVVDPVDQKAVSAAVGRWIADHGLLRMMQHSAAQTQVRFDPEDGARQRISLFKEMHRRWLTKLDLRR